MGLSFTEQLAYEDEGGRAGLVGKTRADCPYDKNTQSGPWNHWVYGCEKAIGELAIIKRGMVEFYSEENFEKPLYTLTVADAIASGQWKPKYAPYP